MEFRRSPPTGSTERGGPPGGTDAAPRVQWGRAAWTLALLLAMLALAAFFRPFEGAALLQQLSKAQPGWLVVACAANFSGVLLLATQWWRLLPADRPTRWATMWECAALAAAGMNTLPFGGGHALGVGLLATRARLGADGALSLLALDQVCEGVAKLGLLLLALGAAPLPVEFQRLPWIIGGATLMGGAILGWIAWQPVPPAAAARWRHRWAGRLDVLKRPRVFGSALALGALGKAVELAAIYAVQRSLGLDMSAAALLVVLAAVSFATMISVVPGNLGVFEAAAFSAYRWSGVPPAEAAALALLQHAAYLTAMIAPGYAVMAARAWRPRPADA